MTAYDVFFSYNWRDRSAVEGVARGLRERGLSVFLDRWSLMPGRPWPQALESVLSTCRAAAVFVGPHGMGPWQQREKDLALNRQTRDITFSVIPVLLPGADPPLGFLSLNTWVDLRGELHDLIQLEVLAAAVRGEPPSPDSLERTRATIGAICPYRGLRLFREEDGPFFFGREALIERLVVAVDLRPLVAAVGASGSGKSSVVRAGLVPVLRRSDSATVWEAVVMMPGERPLHALAAAFVPLLEPEMTEADRLAEVGKLAGYLAEGRVQLRDVVNRALQKQPGTDRLLFVVDQWEELYTLCIDDQARRRFFDEVLDATAESPLSLVLTLRGDFFGHALGYRPLADILQDSVVNVGPMTREELREAVEAPAQSAGGLFEPGLVDRILDDVQDGPGNLPLLEFVLTALWEERHGGCLTHEAYEAMGGARGAIASRAEGLFERLSSSEQEIARRIFFHLVRPGEGTEDTQRRAVFSEIGDAAEPVVRQLADARLVVTARDEATGQRTVEVAHEALIRNWTRLKRWLDEDREFLLWRERLRLVLAEWRRAGRDADALLRGTPLAEAERWLAQRPPEVSPEERDFIRAGVAQRERERAARDRVKRRITLGLAAGLLVSLLLTLSAVSQWHRAYLESQIAVSRQLAAHALNLLDDEIDLSLLLSVEAYRRRDTVEAKRSLLTALGHSQRLEGFLFGHASVVTSVAFSPDGRTVASGSEDETVILWDLAARQPLGPPLAGHKSKVLSVAFSPDGRTMVSGGENEAIVLWDLATRQPLGSPLKGHTGPVTSVAFSPDGKTVVSGSGYGRIILWDVAARRPLGQPLTGHGGEVRSIAFSPDGRTMLSGSENETVILWDVATRRQLGPPLAGRRDVATRRPPGPPIPDARDGIVFSSVAVSPDGKTVAFGAPDNRITLWDVTTRQSLGSPLVGHHDRVSSMAFSPDGKILASSSGDRWGRDRTIILWDVSSRRRLGPPLTGHKDRVSSMAFSPDAKVMVSGSDDRSIILWHVTRRHPLGEFLTGHKDSVQSVAFSPDGRIVASGSIDASIILWDVVGRRALGPPLTGHVDQVRAVAFSPDGKMLGSGSVDSGIILWDIGTHEPVGVLDLRQWVAVTRLALSPDGKLVASDGPRGSIILWDLATRKRLDPPLTGHGSTVWSLGFSRDGKMLASVTGDGSILLWNVMTRQRQGPTLTRDKSWARSVAFSPNGKMLASGYVDGSLIIWDVATHQPLGQPLIGYRGPVWSVSFSPDGKTLASSGTEKSIILWDIAARQPLSPPLIGHEGIVWSLALSPDGKTLASGGDDGSVVLWDVSAESWQSRACKTANRNLTKVEWERYLADVGYRETCPNPPRPR